MLQEETLFGLRDKEQEAIDFLKAHEPTEGYWVAFSGGKDSIVALDLVRRSGVKHVARYSMTTVDPPELVYFIRDNYPEVWEHRIRPKKTMWELIVDKGMLPTRIARYCCDVLKEQCGKGYCIVTGIRAQESSRRAKRKRFEVDHRDKNTTFAHPIFFWSTNEVWEYIRKHHIPYCCLYDEGQKRVGCVMCPFGGGKRMRADMERWPKIADLYMMAADREIKKRLDSGKDSKWKDGKEMVEWWISDSQKKTLVESCDMVPLFSADDDEYFL